MFMCVHVGGGGKWCVCLCVCVCVIWGRERVHEVGEGEMVCRERVCGGMCEKVKEGERCGCGLVGDDTCGFGREDSVCVCVLGMVCVGEGERW